MLLDAKQLSEKLRTEAELANEVILISAFITDSAVAWIASHISSSASVSVVCRAKPHDFLQGASSISALKKILDHGWNLSINQELHAKIYLFDNKHIYVGSSNLTQRGLLLSSDGNLEANTYLECNQHNLLFIKSLIQNSANVDLTAIQKMEEFLLSCASHETYTVKNAYWPTDLLQEGYKNIFSIDFPIDTYGKNRTAKNKFSIVDQHALAGDFTAARKAFYSTRIYQWLKYQLSNKKVLYFGELSKIIHNQLQDDPTPYRKDIKYLLSNLIEYIQYLSNEIIIFQSRHSQALSLSE